MVCTLHKLFVFQRRWVQTSDCPNYLPSLQTLWFSQNKGKGVPLQAWTGPEGSRKLRFPDFVTTAQDCGKVVSLTHRPLLPSVNSPGIHFCSRLSRPQGRSTIGRIMSMKSPLTPAGIEPATCWFVAQHLKHCATAVPGFLKISKQIPEQCYQPGHCRFLSNSLLSITLSLCPVIWLTENDVKQNKYKTFIGRTHHTPEHTTRQNTRNAYKKPVGKADRTSDPYGRR